MIKQLTLAFLLISAITFSSCRKENWPCIKGKGAVTTEERSVTEFTGVVLETEGTLHVIQGSEYKIELKAQSNILEHIITEVKDGELRIYSKRCVRKTDNMDFYITMPAINSLTIAGSGQIFAPDTLHTPALSLTIAGSGNMNVVTKADDVNATISGSGNLDLAGICKTEDITVSGSGNISAFPLQSDDCHVTISGSGHASVTALKRLWVVISGSGSVSYKGSPSIEEMSVSGSGGVTHEN